MVSFSNIRWCHKATQIVCQQKIWKSDNSFYGYDKSNIKNVEHRLHVKQSSVVVVLMKIHLWSSRKTNFFLTPQTNKRFINLLGSYFQGRDYSVLLAGDADILIGKEALNIAQEKHVTIVADDMDISILLLYHSFKKILMQSATQSGKVRNIQAMQRSIGEEARKALLFVYALTRFDTTSALCGKSKSSAFKNIIKPKILCEWALLLRRCY